MTMESCSRKRTHLRISLLVQNIWLKSRWLRRTGFLRWEGVLVDYWWALSSTCAPIFFTAWSHRCHSSMCWPRCLTIVFHSQPVSTTSGEIRMTSNTTITSSPTHPMTISMRWRGHTFSW